MAEFEGAAPDVFSTCGRRAEVTLSRGSISAFLFFCLRAAAAAAQPRLRFFHMVQIWLRNPCDIRPPPAVRVMAATNVLILYLVALWKVSSIITDPDDSVFCLDLEIVSANGNSKMTIPMQSDSPPEMTYGRFNQNGPHVSEQISAKRLSADLFLFFVRSVIALIATLLCRALPLCLALDVTAGKVLLPAVPRQICWLCRSQCQAAAVNRSLTHLVK